MVFSSIPFLLYFLPVFLLIYYLAGNKLKNGVILLGSIFFYAWGAPKFIFVILGTTVLDFLFVQKMHSYTEPFKKKLMLILSLSMNLGLLFYFKYCNFFIDNLNPLLSGLNLGHISLAKVILPIGISFYTFESITYVVDVYRGIHKPLKNFWDYQLYIIFFPKLIAGPIVRYHDIADQITDRFAKTGMDDRLIGFNRFIIGLSKKVLIANVLGQQADQIFNAGNYSQLSGATAWFGALCYSMQIYFDFSGYSDMAIGLARMMGFRLPENFNRPYISQSITEFWKRWHMTLGAWMRNYLYIPLGGNRQTAIRTYANLWIVFLFSGLWHGASWTFIIWGAYHGFWMVMERLGLSRVMQKVPGGLKIIISFLIVVVGWVLFRIDKLPDAVQYLHQLFNLSGGTFVATNSLVIFTLLLAIFISFSAYYKPFKNLADTAWYDIELLKNNKALWLFFVSLILFVLCLSRIVGSDFNPFIYFRF